MMIALTFYYFAHQFNIDFFNRIMLRNCDRLAAFFSKRIMAAAASRRMHFISIAFQHFSKFIETQILRQGIDFRQ